MARGMWAAACLGARNPGWMRCRPFAIVKAPRLKPFAGQEEEVLSCALDRLPRSRRNHMPRLFRLDGTQRRDPAVETWLQDHAGELGEIAQHWFEVLRSCGEDVQEVLHDGHPTACVEDLAFAYVNAFTSHVNVGFFHGAELEDPQGILEGSGRFMRHVKLRPGGAVDPVALTALIASAYADMKGHLPFPEGDG